MYSCCLKRKENIFIFDYICESVVYSEIEINCRLKACPIQAFQLGSKNP